MEGLQEVINTLSIFGSPPYFYFRFRLYGHQDGRFALFLPVQPSNRYYIVQINFLAANHVRIVGLCSQNKAHCMVIFAIAQLSFFLHMMIDPCAALPL